MPIWGVGVTLSHLILDAVTSSDSSPMRSHVREYVYPSIGDPLGVMTSVSGDAVLTITYTVCIKFIHMRLSLHDLPVTLIVTLTLLTVFPILVASHTYCPLLEGIVCLRGVKERVADVSPDRGELSLSH